MAILPVDVRIIGPVDAALQAATDAQLTPLITFAYSQLNALQWGTQIDLGARYLTAHLFTIGSRSGGSGGPTATEKVGDVTRVANVKQEDTVWDSTPYGKQFRLMLRFLGLSSRVLVSGGPSSVPPFGISRFFP